MVPDLSEDDVRQLGALCHHQPYAIKLVAGAISIAKGSLEPSKSSNAVSRLLLAASNAAAHQSLPAIEADMQSLEQADENEMQQMRALAVVILAVLDTLDDVSL